DMIYLISPQFNIHSSAAQCSGEGFYYLKGEAAVLELALIQYAMSKAIKNGYYPIATPDVIRTHVADRCGYQARSGENQYYLLANEDKCLSGTAEIPLAGMYLNKNVLYSDLPIKLVAFGRCFRVETGGRGRGEGRLYRVHQFSKVELFGLTANEDGTESEELLDEMVTLQKEINTELGLHC
uniref:serine--tRNA ligase n=1 Tax=Amphimedon queenslandica TaxID=400682 RepID=A0A1X7STV1_AMPQE